MSECYGKFGLKVRPPQCDGEVCDVCAPTPRKLRADRFPTPHMTPPTTRPLEAWREETEEQVKDEFRQAVAAFNAACARLSLAKPGNAYELCRIELHEAWSQMSAEWKRWAP